MPASGRSCRSYPSLDRHLWQFSLHRALSAARPNDRGSIRFRVPLDASVDVTDAHCAKSQSIVCVLTPTSQAGPKCRTAKPGRSGWRELYPMTTFRKSSVN